MAAGGQRLLRRPRYLGRWRDEFVADENETASGIRMACYGQPRNRPVRTTPGARCYSCYISQTKNYNETLKAEK
jgi:hypothetical protein